MNLLVNIVDLVDFEDVFVLFDFVRLVELADLVDILVIIDHLVGRVDSADLVYSVDILDPVEFSPTANSSNSRLYLTGKPSDFRRSINIYRYKTLSKKIRVGQR